MPNLQIAVEIHDPRFLIAGGRPGGRVSWLVTGLRRDPYAEAHRIPTEVEKPPAEQGLYRYPELYRQPAERGAKHSEAFDALPAAPPVKPE